MDETQKRLAWASCGCRTGKTGILPRMIGKRSKKGFSVGYRTEKTWNLACILTKEVGRDWDLFAYKTNKMAA